MCRKGTPLPDGAAVSTAQPPITNGCPTAYRQRVRAAAAIALLLSSDAKVETIARHVGWRSKKALYKALAMVAQMTPSAIRRLPPSDASILTARINGSL
jgi:AraC-like DNA-binding protein